MRSRFSIAVLPFTNMSPDPGNEYFSDGITEEILNALTRIAGVHVTARTSSFAFKDRHLDIRDIGRRLGVSHLLEGSVRKSENRVRITAHLVEAGNGYRLWNETWDRELKDIFIVQDEIAARIAERINRDMEPRYRGPEKTVEDLDALDYYLRGNYLMNTWDFGKAGEMTAAFEKAIEIDPELTQAYIGLSGTLTWLGSTGVVPPAEARRRIDKCIRTVLELDPDLPELRTIISGNHFWMEWNIDLALKEIERALELKPSYPDALMYRGLLLAAAGRVEEALDSLFQAERLNPLSNQINFTIGLVYNYTFENEKALHFTNRNIEIFPGWYAQYLVQVESLCRLGRFNEAMEVISTLEKDPSNPLSITELKAYYFASKGDREKAMELVHEMEKSLGRDPMEEPAIFFFLGSIYSILEETGKALDYLELGIENGASPLLFVKVDSTWNKLRNHPRFRNATSRIVYPPDEAPVAGRDKKYRKTALDPSYAENLKAHLDQLMQDQKPWMNPGLNLSDLAELARITNHTLSQLLNEHIGKNFYDYVNNFRLTHFRDLATRPRNQNFTLLSLAYDCGFNSKTTFNAFFKKTMSTTPSEYFRRSQPEG